MIISQEQMLDLLQMFRRYRGPSEDDPGDEIFAAITTEVEKLGKDERILRELLWRRHGCAGLYGDDGEMQCSACVIDFKRDAPAHIQARFHRIGEIKYLQSLKDGWHWTADGLFVPPEKEPK